MSAWLSGSSAVAAIARPTPSPIATIRPASQRAIERTCRRRAADEPQQRQLAAALQRDHRSAC